MHYYCKTRCGGGGPAHPEFGNVEVQMRLRA
jgi:hypothetical protein